MQTLQANLDTAIREAPATGNTLYTLARQQREQRSHSYDYHTSRHWETSAGTYCYLTHIAAPNQSPERLDQVADIFFNAATLPSQPWYPQFLGGASAPVDTPPPAGIEQHQLTLGQFDLGLPTPRYYRQLVSVAKPDEQTAVIIARSVATGPTLPAGTRLAYTLVPNGEVLHWESGRLHWHHICCTPGAGLLPGRLDRWLINALRRTGLDGAERATYRQEAEHWRDWISDPGTDVTG